MRKRTEKKKKKEKSAELESGGLIIPLQEVPRSEEGHSGQKAWAAKEKFLSLEKGLRNLSAATILRGLHPTLSLRMTMAVMMMTVAMAAGTEEL